MIHPAPLPSHGMPLKYLFPGWCAVVMGLAGLSLAWQLAVPVMDETAGVTALAIGVAAAVVFAALTIAAALRGLRHPEAWAEDLKHPVRHTLAATLPVALILLDNTASRLWSNRRRKSLNASAVGRRSCLESAPASYSFIKAFAVDRR